MNSINIIYGVLMEGMIFGIVSLGTYVAFRILSIADMTVDGSFPLGMAISAILITKGVPAIITIPIAMALGALSGFITGLIHVKLKVRDILAGIIVMTGLYSINLRVAGRANLPIFNHPTIFKNPFIHKLTNDIGISKDLSKVIILAIITLVCKFILDKYLKTRSGYLLKSVGDNETLVTTLSRDKDKLKVLGLAIANAFVALGGAINAQDKGFFEISAGTGTLVVAIANVIIGLKISSKFKYLSETTCVLIGSILYRLCISIAISLGMEAVDLKLITALLLLVILVLNKDKKKNLKDIKKV